MRTHKSLALAALMAIAVAAPAAAGPKGNGGNDPQGAKDQTNSTLGFYDCEAEMYVAERPTENDHLEFIGDPIMWPPNHKPQTMGVLAQAGTNDDGSASDEMVSLYTESTHDEFFTNSEGEQEELNGSGNTTDDAQDASNSMDPAVGSGSAETSVTLRSERSGRGDGRTYEIDSYAEFQDDDGEPYVCEDSGSGNDNAHPEGVEDSDMAVNFFSHVPHDMRSNKAPAPKSPSLNEDGSPKGKGNG